MPTEEKDQYKVLSDKDRKRFDTEKQLVKKKPKKRDLKEEEKKEAQMESLMEKAAEDQD